jgi:hypothetical protein
MDISFEVFGIESASSGSELRTPSGNHPETVFPGAATERLRLGAARSK